MALHTRLHLNRGEHVVWRRRMTLRSLWLFWLLGLATLPLYGIGLLFVIYAAVKWVRIRYLVTDRRVIRAVDHYAFLLRVETSEVRLGDVEALEVSRTTMGRLLGYMDVTIRGSGTTLSMTGLRDAGEIREILQPYL